MEQTVSGIEPGQRKLNGPQTAGRTYRGLSQPQFGIVRQDDFPARMRDGIDLLSDVYRPDAAESFRF